MDIFTAQGEEYKKRTAPLAERMRPRSFEEFFGQEELVGEGSPLRVALKNDNLSSLIFWGPPGSGKTTLAWIIAKSTKADFIHFSAVSVGIKEVKESIKKAEDRLRFEKRKTIIFLDEIHRFNKAQQDALLPYVEDGSIILIGATTENPSFEVISPLLSRSAVYVLKSLSRNDLRKIIDAALGDKERGLGELDLELSNEAVERVIDYADGDARAGLNALEFALKYLKSEGKTKIEKNDLNEVLKKHALRYDKKGEEHYNLISAFIKSMRDSDPDGALYWLARMVESGEDPKFIVRRMVIFASEDIGNADPQALQVAISVARAVEFIGMPEGQINLAQGTTYLATAPKSNNSYVALLKAKEDAKKGAFGVPMHLRNAVTNLMRKLGYGKDYKYVHDQPEEALEQGHFPEELGEQKYYKNDRKGH